ncbi:MAG: glycosyltransferase family 2 protein [Methylotenera sp.]|nr:glycosyltransferase family 2 protein [Methylotenera sp.]
MSKLLFGIIIPTYNYGHTLRRAVLSVVKQLDEDVELLVIDDGSGDHTAEIIAQLKTECRGQIKFFYKPNGGLASTCNFGIAHANGDYLVFLDADDEMADGAINAMRSHLASNPESKMLIGAHYSVYTNGKRKLHIPNTLPDTAHDRLKGYLLDKTISISNGACAKHKSVFQSILYPVKFRNSEDIPVFAYVLSNYYCTTLDFPLAFIHKHDDSLRHNATHAENVGIHLVDEVFHPSRISTELQTLKKPFLAQRLLSLSRVCHENKRHLQCTQFYNQAIKSNWRVIFNWPYTKKFILSLLQVNPKMMLINNKNERI